MIRTVATFLTVRALPGAGAVLCCMTLAAPLLAMPGDDGAAREAPPAFFMGLQPIEEAELANHRGGISVAGMKFDFAVELRMNTEVMENGEPVFGMTTTLSFNNTDRSQSTEVRTGDVHRVVHDTMTTVDASREKSGRAGSSGPGSDGARAATATIENLSAKGSRLRFDDGQTRVMQELAANHLATVIQNVGHQRTINQQVEMDLMISNFTDQLREFHTERLGQRLGRDLMGLGLGR